MKKAILWDVDGLIFNSDEIYFAMLKKELEEYNITLKEHFYGGYGLDSCIHYFPIGFHNILRVQKSINTTYYTDEILPQLKYKEGMEQALKALRKKYRFAIASGEKKEQIERYLRHFNIEGLFEVIGHSESATGRKSNPLFFEFLLEKMGLTKEEVVFVGDSVIDSEVSRFGIDTCIVPSCYTKHGKFDPDAKVLNSIEELL